MNPHDYLNAGAIVLAALIAFFGSKYMADRSKAGAERSAQIQADAGIASGYSLLTNDLRKDIEDLRRDRDADRRAHREQRLQDLSRMDEIEKRLDQAVARYRAALAYIRLLLAFFAEKAPGHAVPPPPDDLMLDLN